MLILKNGQYIWTDEVELLPETVIPYEMAVRDMIREKYSLDEELAIQRQRDTKPEEFEAYFQYCEECKRKAKGEQ